MTLNVVFIRRIQNSRAYNIVCTAVVDFGLVLRIKSFVVEWLYAKHFVG